MNFDWKRLFRKHPIFATIRDDQRIDALLRVSEERDFVKDAVIVHQGEKGNSLFVIGSGSAEAALEVGKGESIPLSTMRNGDVFGEMAFFEQTSRTATVRAKEPCTVLEIQGLEFQSLVDEYPDIGSRLLLMMGERLRHTNEQILALHLKTVDERLKEFSNRLDTEQRVGEASLKAAQTVFDQTKLRTDEVIDSAERSRDRLNKAAAVVGTFVTILVTLLGLFGLKEVLSMGKLVDQVKNDANAVGAIKKNAEDSMTGVQKLQADLKNSKIAIYRARFFDALNKGFGDGARQAYNEINAAEGLDDDQLNSLLWGLEHLVVAKAQPPKTDQEKSDVKNFVLVFQQAVLNTKRARYKLDAYYLLLVYAYLTNETEFEVKEGDFKNLATPKNARDTLDEYVKSTSEEQWRPATSELASRIKGEPGERGKYLRKLSEVARVSV